MKQNISIALGGVSLIDKVEKDFGLISGVFDGISDRARDFIGRVKLLLYNRLTYAVSVHRILETYPHELFELLGIGDEPSERSLYRTLELVGKCYPVLMERYQEVLREEGLVDNQQVLDFSSTYFEGEKASLGAYGYSRDRRPDRKQVNLGISTGINNIPSAITIQRGNVQDKRHLRMLLKVASKVLEENSLLIFDAGANSKPNKKRIRKMGFHYLTLKPKKVKTYKKYLHVFSKEDRQHFRMNNREYICVKKRKGEESLYIYFSPQLLEDQLRKKERRFQREKEKGNILAKKAERHKPAEKYPSDKGWVELYPELQTTLKTLDNPYITGIEGFFILESSLDAEPKKILGLYKDRDKAEKFVRALKEGNELRPLRHWSKWAILGAIFICFLATAIYNLTVKIHESSPVKNLKLLKKFLKNLTLVVIYPPGRFQVRVVSNVTPQIRQILGDLTYKYGDKNLHLRW
jgi:transposase